ncbi:PLP-dependent transferase [Streptomyces sp. ActVer]|uniref:PLP-dependent transferase n=1 Tax=Streptomyces sp. ActVer TaxID=3014558 RepID=UPI0022B55BA8|nr:PLP-dependent transferase [Streptomyces sp. ActVer]MCZ4512023.1 PLP-dependent transferase [Streptomyces sp. ActVer]
MSKPSTPLSRPDKHDPATLAVQTQAVHCGNQADVGTGAIRTPVIMANSCTLPDDPFTLDPDNPDLLVYTRESGANQLGLQAKLATLEGGEDAVVLGSGMAALYAAFFTHLPGFDVIRGF